MGASDERGARHAGRHDHDLPRCGRHQRRRGVAQRSRPRRAGRATRLRLGVGRRAPLHLVHHVPRRAAVPDVHGGPHQADAVGLDGGDPAVARPGARRRAGDDAGHDVRWSLHLRDGPRSRSRRVRGLRHRRWTSRGRASSKRPRWSCRVSSRATSSTTGKYYQQPRRDLRPGRHAHLPRPDLRRCGVARVGARSWPASVPASSSTPRRTGRRSPKIWCSTAPSSADHGRP